MRPEYGEAYRFMWDDLGDVALGRPNLGDKVPVMVYRLAQYTMREAIALTFDEATATRLLRESGWIAGREFCLNVLNPTLEFPQFVDQLQRTLREQGIGILRLEKSDLESLTFVLTVSEDLDCSGLPIQGKTVCDYDEGFIAGIMHAYTGREFRAVEVDCWATGDRTCRFAIAPETVSS